MLRIKVDLPIALILIPAILFFVPISHGENLKPEINRVVSKKNLDTGEEIYIEITINNPYNESILVSYSEHIPDTFLINEINGFTRAGAILSYSGKLNPFSSFNGNYRIKATSEGSFNISGVCYYNTPNGSNGTVSIVDQIVVLKPINYPSRDQKLFLNVWFFIKESWMWITFIFIIAINSLVVLRLSGRKSKDKSGVSVVVSFIIIITLVASYLIWLNDPSFYPFLLIILFLSIIYVVLLLIGKYAIG